MPPLPPDCGPNLARYTPFRDQERRQRAIAAYLLEEVAALAPSPAPALDLYA